MCTACIIGISGYSGTGKTTLIEKLLPLLKKEGLYVGVLKHIHHKLDLDIKGKDTDRFYRAGADYVWAHDAGQCFARSRYQSGDLYETISLFPSGLDLVLVEGHKEYALPGIWLEKGRAGKRVTGDLPAGKKTVSRDDPGYVRKAVDFINEEMERIHAARVVQAGLLIGGKSRRMGKPKSLLLIQGKTLVERSYSILSEVAGGPVLLGSAQLPGSIETAMRLSDVTDLTGPISGMLSAFRWSPKSAWLISSVDMPLMRKEAWKWLLSQRRPGAWAVMPRIKGGAGVETTGAVYEPMIFKYVEALAKRGVVSLQEIALHNKTITPVIPQSLESAWRNVNTPGEWEEIRGVMKKYAKRIPSGMV